MIEANDRRSDKDYARLRRFLEWDQARSAIEVLSAYQVVSRLEPSALGALWGVNSYPSDGGVALRVTVGRRESLTIRERSTVDVYLAAEAAAMHESLLPAQSEVLTPFEDDQEVCAIRSPLTAGAWFVGLPNLHPLIVAYVAECTGPRIRRDWYSGAFHRVLRTTVWR